MHFICGIFCNVIWEKHAILKTVIIAIIIIKFWQKGPWKKQSESYLDMWFNNNYEIFRGLENDVLGDIE